MARCARAVKSRGRHLDDAGVRSTSRRPEHEGLVTRQRSEVIVVATETDVAVGAHREEGDLVDVEERGGRWFDAPCRLGRVLTDPERRALAAPSFRLLIAPLSTANRAPRHSVRKAWALRGARLFVVVEPGAQRELEEVISAVLRDEHVVEQLADLLQEPIAR